MLPAKPSLLVSLLVLVSGVACSGSGQWPYWLDFDVMPDIADIELGHINPGEPFTYLELRQAEHRDPDVYADDEYRVLSSHGTPCLEATDPSACEEALRAVQPVSRDGFQSGLDYYRYFVVNRGDDVAALASPEDVLALLGRIDNREEALLLAASHSYWWSATDRSKGGIRAVLDGGFQLIVTRGRTGCDTHVHLLDIPSDGSVTILDSWTREWFRGCDPSREYSY